MSDNRLDDELLLAVRATRPRIEKEVVSPNGAAAEGHARARPGVRPAPPDTRVLAARCLGPIGRGVSALGAGQRGCGSMSSCQLSA